MVITRILCPVDFSETSSQAFQYADRLAQSEQAQLILLHAFDVPERLGLLGQDRACDPHLAERLEQVRSTSPELRVERVLHAGPAGKVICWLAEQRACDLIVMGTHGRTGLAHLLLGSVAEHVLRHARCPVLVVRLHLAHEPALPEPKVLPVPPPRFM